MKSTLLSTSLLFLFCLSANAQIFHTPVYSDLEEQQLLDKLVEDFKPLLVQTYGDARDIMYSEIYNENDSVSGIYTNHTLYLDPNEPPREFLFMNGAPDGINAEHTYPQSKGAGQGNPRSDMHHLYPSRAFVNNARSSKIFAEINDSNTDTWFYLDQSQNNIPSSSQINLYSENDSDAFEPRESVKGNIARAMMYFYTMYKSEADAQDPNFFWDQIETLCDWHYADPVDASEYERNFMIADYQEGKSNPFVLDCTVAGRSYCDMISDLCATTAPVDEALIELPVELFPNPNQNSFTIYSEALLQKIEVLDLNGRIIIQKHLHDNASHHITHQLDSGNYICRFYSQGAIWQSLFVVQ